MIETPEEFAQQVEKAIVHQYQQSPNGRGGLMIISKDYIPAGKLIAARDAAIRAECAERAIACLKNNYQDWPNIVTGMHQLRAAIMAEPKADA